MLQFSKSKYCRFWQCPKMSWLDLYKPELHEVDPGVEERMKMGTQVGELARDLFGAYTDVSETIGQNPDIPRMLVRTQEELQKQTEVICEAAFEYQGLYCAVDLLRREPGGWSIYEVKSSTASPESQETKAVYAADVAYQKYVLEKCGITVVKTYIVNINSVYVYDGNLDLQQLFIVMDISKAVEEELQQVAGNLSRAEQILRSKEEPEKELHQNCRDPYACPYWNYCTRNLPEKSVFDLYRLPFKKKLEYY